MNTLSTIALGASAAFALPTSYNDAEIIDGSYIVRFHSQVVMEEHMEKHRLSVEHFGGKIVHEYDINEDFRGFAFAAGPNVTSVVHMEMLAGEYESMDHVKFVEEDQIMKISRDGDSTCLRETQAPWGLARTTSGTHNHESIYKYSELQGEGAEAYIIDSGVYVGHSEFTGRIGEIFDKYHNPPTGADGNGHGTHVAGTVAGTTYGIAKHATINVVKVLSDAGSGTNAAVIDGVNFACTVARRDGPDGPALNKRVINMSLGGGPSRALNEAVEACKAAGVVVVAAAGNEYDDACYHSPASSTAAISVMATTIDDTLASFSNTGTCTQIAAPGQDITSAWINGPTSTNTISGTSMASPHVAGVAALIRSHFPAYTPDDVLAKLLNDSVDNLVSRIPGNSPNALLQAGCDL